MGFSLGKYKNFIFDFDGVIADSVEIKTEAFKELYKPFGDTVAMKVARHHRAHGGLDRFRKIEHYHKEYLNQELSQRQVNALARRFADLVLHKVIKTSFIKGALRFLNTLSKKQKKMFLISATPEDEIKKIVTKRKIEKYFLEIKGAPLTKKENLGLLAKKYKLNPGDSVYFGDSQQDLDAANYFKIKFIPINYFNKKIGYRDFEELIESFAR